MLEDSSTPYKKGDPKDGKSQSPGHVFAMPAAKSPSGLLLSQTTAIAAWMGDEVNFGLYGVSARHIANKVANDIADVWSEGYKCRCLCNEKVSSVGASEWLKINDGRFLRLLKCIHATRSITGTDDSDYLFGEKVSYVDFLLLNAIITMEFCFTKEKVDEVVALSGLTKVVENTRARPNIKAFLAKDVPVLYDGVMGEKLDWTK